MDKGNNVGNHPSQCYGCSACECICPKQAITLTTDKNGFLYPQIDADKCINCGLCLQVCPIEKENSFKSSGADRCYAVKNSDSVRIDSSSGGIYTALTDQILKVGGVCIGTAYSDNHKVIYTIAEDTVGRNAQRGSKYVQSYMSPLLLKRVIEIIEAGRSVLISGTPCQVAGIKSLLSFKKIVTDKVLFIDIVCHGTPSPELWMQYLSEIERTHNSKIAKYTFRDKEKGWRGYHVRIELENGTILEGSTETDSFVNMFKENLTLRDSCFKCPYASMSRCGDITIGDFWGIEDIDAAFSDNKGISMVLANTDKGKGFLSAVVPQTDFQEYSSRVITQSNMHNPSQHGLWHRNFWKVFRNKGYKGVIRRFASGGSLYALYYYRKAIKLRAEALKKELS